ncbi:hypothetical protein BDZ45DRAFT_602885 [Acephala macrosclerotiorum]|nr:hypothetical protein BDZ45DRAFT_602885 [Acephala macrosclerotiorum]
MIDTIKKAVALTLEEQSEDFRRRRSKLNVLLEKRFAFRGDIEDLEDGIVSAERIIAETKADHAALPDRLTNLANMLAYRFERTGDVEDIDRAIVYADQAIQISEKKTTPDGSESIGPLLRNLAVKLELRSQRTGSLVDLKEAIAKIQEAQNVISTKYPLKLQFMTEEANMLALRFQREKEMGDLNEAIRIMEEALKNTPNTEPSKPILQHDLGKRYLDRYLFKRNKKDLDAAIDRTKWAITRQAMLTYHHPLMADYHCSLSQMYVLKEEITPGISSKALSYTHAHKALQSIPDNHPSMSDVLDNLGDAAYIKWKFMGIQSPYLKEAISSFRKAAEHENGHPFSRIRIYKKMGDKSLKHKSWDYAFQEYSSAIQLWPKLNPRALDSKDREFVVGKLSKLGSLAAVCALRAKGSAEQALEAFESGRGMIAGLAIDSRADVSGLKEQDKDLYTRYIRLRNATMAPLSVDGEDGKMSEESVATAASHRGQKIRELQAIEDEMLRLQDPPGFLQQLQASDFMKLAKFGPIVSFNITDYGSHAFIVTEERIRTLELQNLSHDAVEERVKLLADKTADPVGTDETVGPVSTNEIRNQAIRPILKWLWDEAVEPVLRELELISPTPPDRLPRIWWVTSGLMGLLPLHAAGSNWRSKRENTMSHVLSSYVPTFKALKHARSKDLKLEDGVKQLPLIVSMPVTPEPLRKKYRDLEVKKEIEGIMKSFSLLQETKSLLEGPTRKDVLKELESASIAHFICHGESEELHPSESGLILQDRRLTVRDLAASSLGKAQIAYLSACHTADTKSKELIDESIHIASAFQLVGFPHVIGTLWPMRTKYAEKAAPMFYKALVDNLKKGESGNDAVAYAWHRAVRGLWEIGRLAREDVIGWAPIIHLGA